MSAMIAERDKRLKDVWKRVITVSHGLQNL